MFSSPGLRFVRVARPVEPEVEETEEVPPPAQQAATSTDTSAEPQAPASTEVEVETNELYLAEEDPRNDEHPDAEHDGSPATAA